MIKVPVKIIAPCLTKTGQLFICYASISIPHTSVNTIRPLPYTVIPPARVRSPAFSIVFPSDQLLKSGQNLMFHDILPG